MNNQTLNQTPPPAAATVNVFQVQEKSLLVAFLLSLFFGPLGMLYSTIAGGVIMLVVYLAIFGLSLITFGMASLLFLPAWIVCIVWAMIAAKSRIRTIAT